MAGALVLTYPHYRPSLEPRPMRAVEVWRVAEAARAQACPHPRRPKVDVARVVARCGRLRVNGIDFEAHWECGEPVRDEDGRPVLGATEHDDACPDAAMIYVNGEAIGDREELARSTALHELGHAVFDAPAWVERARRRATTGHAPERRFKLPEDGPGPAGGGIDWREWRANEFMGAFLAPRPLVHKVLLRHAIGLGLPMLGAEGDGLPVVNAMRARHEGVEALCLELADEFGVSPAFIEVRLRKYGLVRAAAPAA